MYSTSSHRCYGTGNTCPSSKITSCTHSEDVTVQCCKIQYSNTLKLIQYLAYSSSYSRSTNTKTTCKGLISKYFTSSSFIIIIIKILHLIEL